MFSRGSSDVIAQKKSETEVDNEETAAKEARKTAIRAKIRSVRYIAKMKIILLYISTKLLLIRDALLSAAANGSLADAASNGRMGRVTDSPENTHPHPTNQVIAPYASSPGKCHSS